MDIGLLGEQVAKSFLEERGYTFLTSNYRAKEGEIDLIMNDPEQDQVVFVEVKTRNAGNPVAPNDMLSEEKLMRIAKTASYYTNENDIENWRFELVAVTLENGIAKAQLIEL
jgi:putative endonuclease